MHRESNAHETAGFSGEENIAVNYSNLTNSSVGEHQHNEGSDNTEKTNENMEIHHPHAPHHERKLKDYFFEFFMLFLAVTAGFFMENVRENYIENHKEHQYIYSLIRDLQEDTTSIQETIRSNEDQIKGIDSLLVLLESPASKLDIPRLYYLSKYVTTLDLLSSREVTITQLRSSGGLRLIDNSTVSDSIVYYYETYESRLEQQQFDYKLVQGIVEMQMKNFDLSAYRVKGRPMTFDTSQTKEFYNRIILFESMLSIEVEWLKGFYKQSTSLLKLLKKEYEID
jgi:hypothetical protein